METTKKLNIAILSDSPFLTTGYSTISKEVGNILSQRGHNVYFLASNYVGQNLKAGSEFEDGKKLNFNIIGQGREAYFKDLLSVYMKQYKIDVLFILLDTFMLYPWIMQLDLSPAKTIFYYPSDGGGGMPLGCEQILKFINCPVAMAKFGRDQVKKMYGIETKYVPHAIDTKQFFPMSKEERLKYRHMFGISDEKYVIGSVARNQGRKMMDRTIKSFALYARKDPDAVLFLHTDPDDAAQVFHMTSLIHRYNVQNRVMFSGMRYYKGFDYSQMNAVYNIMDVFILTTSGEGFGIPIIEAMGAGISVLATDYTTTRDLVVRNNAGLGINLIGVEEADNPDVHCDEILEGTITGSWNVERGISSLKDACDKLVVLKDDKLREKYGINGRAAVLKEYNWDVCGKQWLEIIEKLGEEY